MSKADTTEMCDSTSIAISNAVLPSKSVIVSETETECMCEERQRHRERERERE